MSKGKQVLSTALQAGMRLTTLCIDERRRYGRGVVLTSTYGVVIMIGNDGHLSPTCCKDTAGGRSVDGAGLIHLSKDSLENLLGLIDNYNGSC